MEEIDRLILKQEIAKRGTDNFKKVIRALCKTKIHCEEYKTPQYRVDKHIIEQEFDKTNTANRIVECAMKRIAVLEKKRSIVGEKESPNNHNSHLSKHTRYWMRENGNLKLQTVLDANDKESVLKMIELMAASWTCVTLRDPF